MNVKVSVRARLTILYDLVFLLGFILFGMSAYVGLQSTIVKVVDNELSSRLDGVDNFLVEHVSRLPADRLQQDLSLHVALKPALLVIQGPAGDSLYCGTSLKALCGSLSMHVSPFFTTIRDQRVLSVSRVIKGAPYRICMASDLGFATTILHKFSFWLLLIVPLALLSSTLGGYWLSGRALEPVRGIIKEVHGIGEHSLSMRLQVPKTGDDIQVLSETLNGMLARVESAFRQVRELTANASHELRTPVSIIRTSAEIALLNALPTIESHRQALLQICAEAEKNSRLLDHMLMLARTDSRVQTLQFTGVSLPRSIRQPLAACRHLAEAKNIEILCEEGEEVYLWADASHLNRLWLLLLDNAIKYTPRGGKIVIRTCTDAINDPVCEIVDTGIGIESRDLPNIFDRFFRAENARLTSEVGSGLGLAIAQWIVDVHEARLSVESALGAGSTFRVRFRAHKQPPAGEGIRQDVATSLVAPPSWTRSGISYT
jgi:signal transduction histidine kinase